jgi:E3 ubiquitin-protein ligase synoviolin
MRAAGVTLLSITLTAAVIGNAFYQKNQFYPSVVYITKSNPCMAVSLESSSHIQMLIFCISFAFCFQVIYIQAFVLVFLMGKLMRKVFFGQLRAAEFEVCAQLL